MKTELSSTSGRYRSQEYEMESLACSYIHSCTDPAIRDAVEKCVKRHYEKINKIRLEMYAEINDIIKNHL